MTSLLHRASLYYHPIVPKTDRASHYHHLPNSDRAPPPDSNNRLNLRFTAISNRASYLSSLQTYNRAPFRYQNPIAQGTQLEVGQFTA